MTKPAVWFYSDPHFDHENIIKYCNRPFLTVDEMNATLLDNYNKRVKPDDIVYFLGDMTFGRGNRGARWWLKQLNGNIVYIKGSHDQGIRPTSVGLNATGVFSSLLIRVAGADVMITHDPNSVECYDGIIVHGHVHNYQPVVSGNRINISCDAVGFRPVSEAYVGGLVLNILKRGRYDK